MKRLFSIIMTLLLSFSISVPSSANFSSQNAVGMEINNELIQNALIPENSDVSISRGIYRCEVNADGVNVREQPTTASTSLGMMNRGDIVYSQRIILTYRPTDITLNGVIVLRSCNVVNDQVDLNDLVRVDTTIRENQFAQENDMFWLKTRLRSCYLKKIL